MKSLIFALVLMAAASVHAKETSSTAKVATKKAATSTPKETAASEASPAILPASADLAAPRVEASAKAELATPAEAVTTPPTSEKALEAPVERPKTVEVSAKKLTLDESISKALTGAATVLKSDRDRQLSGTQLLQGYFQFLPNLTAQGAYNYNQGRTFLTQSVPTSVDGSSYGPSYQISTTLNVFNGFSDWAALKAATERKDAAEKTLTRVKQQISLDISQLFLQVVLDQKLIQIAEKNYKASKERQELLQEQTKVGVRNMSDLFRQQAQTSADESYMISVQNRRQNDLILLLRRLRIDANEKYELVEPPLEEKVETAKAQESVRDENEMLRRAFENRKDFEVSKLAADAAHWDVTNSRGSYFPKIDFVASYGSLARHFNYQTVNGVEQTPASQTSLEDQLRNQTSASYGVVLTWTLFDRWVTSTAVERSKAVAYKADIDKEDYHNQVVGEVKQAINDFRATALQFEASDKGLTAARKAFEVSQGRYEVGSLTFVDLSTAQTALVQAEAARAQALIGYELQKRTIEFVMGTTQVQ